MGAPPQYPRDVPAEKAPGGGGEGGGGGQLSASAVFEYDSPARAA
eukprot:COSAG01_NODE_72488_length_253_cov_0.207792_1_plen_44_part_01